MCVVMNTMCSNMIFRAVGGFKEWVDGWAEEWVDGGMGWFNEWVDRWV